MEANIKLGRIWGIPIGLHSSWFLIFGLVTWSLAAGYFPGEFPAIPKPAAWLLGGVTSLLFFGSVLLHELGHTFFALRNNIPVRGISLFIFGGVAQIAREPRTPGAEFRIAIAGPIVSFALALLFGGLWLIAADFHYLAAPCVWLARINLSLAVFNLIPGFPLDGGRVLRAVVWQATGSFHRATQVASFTGQLSAFGFIAVGLVALLSGGLFNGLWLIFIGWFLQNAAAATHSQANLQQSLQGVTVGQVMACDCYQVSRNETLQQLVDERILTTGRRCLFVAEDDRLLGILTLRDISQVTRSDWSKVTAEEAMMPWDKLTKVQPDTSLLEALQAMDDAKVAQVPVVEDDRLAGMLSREEVISYLRLRHELKI